MLHTGGNSGYQAANLAALLNGGARLILLGYDMMLGPNGERHHHPDHPGRNPDAKQLARWAGLFATIEGYDIVNCSRRSAIDCFPRADLEDVL